MRLVLSSDVYNPAYFQTQTQLLDFSAYNLVDDWFASLVIDRVKHICDGHGR